MGFMQNKKKEPYEMLSGKGAWLAAPFVYLIAGFVVLPSVAFLSLVIVLRKSIAAWGGFIIVAAVILWLLTVVVGAWAYVAGKRADSQKAVEANHNHNYIFGGGAPSKTPQQEQEATVTIERPEQKALVRGKTPWVLTGGNEEKSKIKKKTKIAGTIRKRA